MARALERTGERPEEPAAERRREGASPVLIVAGTLLTVVLAAAGIFAIGDYRQDLSGGGSNLAGEAPVGACGQGAEDPSYSVVLAATPDPPSAMRTTLSLTVRQEGRLVSGAKVCLTADMPEMQHPGINKVAKEAAGGRYEADMQFGMGGNWKTAVTIAEPGKPVVSVPLTISVQEVG